MRCCMKMTVKDAPGGNAKWNVPWIKLIEDGMHKISSLQKQCTQHTRFTLSRILLTSSLRSKWSCDDEANLPVLCCRLINESAYNQQTIAHQRHKEINSQATRAGWIYHTHMNIIIVFSCRTAVMWQMCFILVITFCQSHTFLFRHVHFIAQFS